MAQLLLLCTAGPALIDQITGPWAAIEIAGLTDATFSDPSLYPERGPSWGCPVIPREFQPLSLDTLLTALEQPFVHGRKGKVGGGREREEGGRGADRESLQTDRDDVPRGCSTGQVFIAGSFVRIPLLINDYPNSMIDRQYRWLAALSIRIYLLWTVLLSKSLLTYLTIYRTFFSEAL